MNEEVYGALKRIIEEVKEKRRASCPMKDCIVNDIIGGNDIDLIEDWIDEVVKENETESHIYDDNIIIDPSGKKHLVL